MTDETRFAPNATVQLLSYESALAALRADLREPGPCLVYAYLMDPMWFHDLFGEHLESQMIMILADHRQRSELRRLLSRYHRLRAATWSTNRTMHDKTLIFPKLNVTYLTTSNLTRGSWTLAMNSVARIHCPALRQRLEDQFNDHWKAARSLPALYPV
jgi:phosphatidylserine/phosphatidylglycerophosphate/cardiolipin synthase-like enzyme